MRTALFSVVAAAALLASASAWSQGYVGAGAGVSRINVDCAEIPNCDKTDTGWKLFAGYKFHRNFAVEGNYFDFGKAKASGYDPELETDISARLKATGMGLGVAAFAEFTPNWAGVARAGFARTKAKLTVSADGGSESDSNTSTNPYFGIGASYAFSKNLSLDLGLDFSRVKYVVEDEVEYEMPVAVRARPLENGSVTTTSTEKANVRLLSLGVTYRF